MTPDIREKAERLAKEFIAANGPSYLEDQPWCEELASALSQALLEAHKAGREEAAAWHDERVEKMRAEVVPPGEESDLRDMVKRQHIAIHEYAATAIRSIK